MGAIAHQCLPWTSFYRNNTVSHFNRSFCHSETQWRSYKPIQQTPRISAWQAWAIAHSWTSFCPSERGFALNALLSFWNAALSFWNPVFLLLKRNFCHSETQWRIYYRSLSNRPLVPRRDKHGGNCSSIKECKNFSAIIKRIAMIPPVCHPLFIFVLTQQGSSTTAKCKVNWFQAVKAPSLECWWC